MTATANRGITLPTLISSTTWETFIQRHLERVRVRVAAATIALLAERLGEFGPPDSPSGIVIYEELAALLLTPTIIRTKDKNRKAHTHRALPGLEDRIYDLPHREMLLHIVLTLKRYRQITGQDIAKQRFNPDRVIETILLVPSPDTYISHLHQRGLSALAAIFHPNTLARAKKESSLRGIFRGSNEYWDSTASQLNIVTD